MSEGAVPKIKVTDDQKLDGSSSNNGNGTSNVDSQSTTAGNGLSIRPRSATSSEGMETFAFSLVVKGSSLGSGRQCDCERMFPCCMVVVVFVLTKVIVAGNQLNNKKGPVNIIRNSSAKDLNGERQSSPPLRPSTAIDPLSHVSSPSASYVHTSKEHVHKHINTSMTGDPLTSGHSIS